MSWEPDQLRALNSARGRIVARAGKVLYEHSGRVDHSDCMLQLTMENGATILLSSGSDGESLGMSDTPWVDPFAEPLSNENREFVHISGKWTFFDESTQEDMAKLVGATLHAARPIRDKTG